MKTNKPKSTLLKGIIEESRFKNTSEGKKLNGVIISDENGDRYYAHLGDFKENEYLVYQSSNIAPKKGDEVEFEPFEPNIKCKPSDLI
ncbi:hypothetical protein [Candidiatus Paracoxiella cheracis]|uniref:hypothetical protein n=1 Tax=Candidiatus Paracoxiella cheracis TaxID=3405120 RepID=UPI003BF56310